MQNQAARMALGTSLRYGLVAGVWILLSDRVLDAVVTNPTAVAQLQTYKGWAFVIVTTLALYVMLRDQLQRLLGEVDIRRQAEDALRQSEERFAKAFHANPAAMAFTRLSDGQVIDVNEGYERMFGYSRDEVIGSTAHRLNVFPAPTAPEEILRRLREHRALHGYEATLRARSGALLDLLLSNEPIEVGGDSCVLSIMFDITERKRAEAEVHRLNEELEQRVADRTAALARANAELQIEIAERALLEAQIRAYATRATALAELSHALAETGPRLQPLFDTIARRIAELTGDTSLVATISADGRWLETQAIYDADPARPALPHALTDESPYPVGEGVAGQVAQTGAALLVPVVSPELRRAQARPEHPSYLDRIDAASLLIVPLRSRDRILGTLSLARSRPALPYTHDDQVFLEDMAARAGLAIENARLFVDLRSAREAAERASRAKSDFLANMSHELRTPLNAVIGFTSMLLMKLPGPLTADQTKQLTIVHTNAQHLLALISDLLDLTKIEAGKLEVQLQPVVCQDVLGEVAASLRPLAAQKGLHFTLDAPAEPVVLRTDQRALSQIVINLVNNAIKFTDQGEVRVTLAREPVDGRPCTVIRVVDTGIGITPEDHARLFQAFERGGDADVRRREGTGLGLRLSLQLAQLLGGQIVVQSTHGLGSTFTLLLPDS
ncbi:MAG: PAS domain S-box protein [Kouleothrix sp.]|nr:PAS domain S-box protein [Kouleothrix sp.]